MGEGRYFTDDVDLHEGQTLTLPEEEQKHLRVLRTQLGDAIELINGRGILAKATLTSPTSATIHEVHPSKPKEKNITLALAFLRPKSLDWVIEKGTELGATTFWLFPGEKSEKKTLSEKQKTRFRHLMISAIKQCNRLDLPSLHILPPLANWSAPTQSLFFGDPSSPVPLTSPSEKRTTCALPKSEETCEQTPFKSAVIVIGPESGFTPFELKALRRLGGYGRSLSANILRAETAAICALAKVM